MNPANIPLNWNSGFGRGDARVYEAVHDTNGYISCDTNGRVVIPVSEILERVSAPIEHRSLNRFLNNQALNDRYEHEMHRRLVDQFNTCYYEGSVEAKEIMMRILWAKNAVYSISTIEVAGSNHFDCGNGLIRTILEMMKLLEKESEGKKKEEITEWIFKLTGALDLSGENDWMTIKAKFAVIEEFAEDFDSDIKWVEAVIWVIDKIIDRILNQI